MKKKSITKLLAIIATIIVVQACNQNDKAASKGAEAVKELAHADYQCPMDCEKGKIYHAPGKCPVCGMDLEKIKHQENEKVIDENNVHDTAHEAKHQHKEGEKHEHKEGEAHEH